MGGAVAVVGLVIEDQQPVRKGLENEKS